MDGLQQVPVGRRDHAGIRCDGLVSPQALELTLL